MENCENCENREGVYTQLATAINRFAEHRLTKVDLFEQISGLIEMADEDEKKDRLEFEKFWKKQTGIVGAKDMPYSNWKDGFNMVEH